MPTAAEVEFQAQLERTIETGFWQLMPERQVHLLAFFAGLRQILKVLTMDNKRVYEFRAEFDLSFSQANLSVINETKTAADFPEMRVHQRRALLSMAKCLLADWSTHFIKLSKKHSIWSSIWLKHLEEERNGVLRSAPFWLWEVVTQHLTYRKYQPTSVEIAAAIRFLIARNEPIKARRVCLLLDSYSQKVKYQHCLSAKELLCLQSLY